MTEPTTREKLLDLIASGQVQHQPDAVQLLGVTRQRISRILKEEGITLRPRPPRFRPTCRTCGRKFNPGPQSGEETCSRCMFDARRVTLVCPLCGKSRGELWSQARLFKSQICSPCWKRKGFAEVGRKVAARRRGTRFWMSKSQDRS